MGTKHSAILSTFITLTFVIKILVLSIFEWPFTQVLLYSAMSSIVLRVSHDAGLVLNINLAVRLFVEIFLFSM